MTTNIKTVADFKRAMVVGSVWHTSHQYIGENPSEVKDMGVRSCEIAQSNSFALRDPLKDRPSWCDWPKASEFSASGNVVTITKQGFCRLIYTKQEA